MGSHQALVMLRERQPTGGTDRPSRFEVIMTKRIQSVTVAIAATMTVLSACPVSACSCGGASTVERSFEAADAVFFGEVSSQAINRSSYSFGEPREINFRVLQSWKGVTGEFAGIRTSSSTCGITPLDGQRMLVYAFIHRFHGELSIHLCSRTRRIPPFEDIDRFAELGFELIELAAGPALARVWRCARRSTRPSARWAR